MTPRAWKEGVVMLATVRKRIKILEQCFSVEPDVPVDDATVTQALQSMSTEDLNLPVSARKKSQPKATR